MATGLTYAPGLRHNFVGHPEHAGRMEGTWQILTNSGVLSSVVQIAAPAATQAQLLRVHTPEHIAAVEAASQRGGMIGNDTYVTEASFEAALNAAGAAVASVDAVLTGRVANAVSIVRPPGHHAGASKIEGFCLFNSIAVAARHAQTAHNIGRIAIIDFDVHHGNGTQAIFYEDNSVHFTSMHMLERFFYPGSGKMHEDGTHTGTGYNVNIPLPPFVGDAGCLRAFDEIAAPLVEAFNPDLILVSAGFDGHWRDPLSHMNMTLTGYAQLCQRIVALADRLCAGRLVCLIEGGYDIEALGHGVLNLIYALMGTNQIHDPLGPSGELERDISDLIVKLQQFNLLA